MVADTVEKEERKRLFELTDTDLFPRDYDSIALVGNQ